jgi:hypothetical protein
MSYRRSSVETQEATVASQRRAGTIQVQANGEIYDGKGWFSYDLGHPMRKPIAGADRVHGYKEVPRVPYIEGVITDSGTLDLAALPTYTDVTVTLSITDGETIVLSDAWSVSDGVEENVVRFEGRGQSRSADIKGVNAPPVQLRIEREPGARAPRGGEVWAVKSIVLDLRGEPSRWPTPDARARRPAVSLQRARCDFPAMRRIWNKRESAAPFVLFGSPGPDRDQPAARHLGSVGEPVGLRCRGIRLLQ